MEADLQAVSDADDELEMDFVHSPSSYSDSNSTHTLDSGLSSGATTGSDSSWSPYDGDDRDEDWIHSRGVAFCLEAQSVLIHQAVQCLNGTDHDCSTNASAYIFHLCRAGYGRFIIDTRPDALSYFLSAVRDAPTDGNDTSHFLSGALHYLSHTEEGVDFILSSNGIDILSCFLRSSAESVLYYSLTALHSLLLMRKNARDAVRQSCIVIRLISLLNQRIQAQVSIEKGQSSVTNESNPKFLAILCDCLHILTYGHEATKRIFVEEGAIPSLLQLISCSTYEKLLWTGIRLLRVLSAWMLAKQEVLSYDTSLRFFKQCLENGSVRVAASALWTLRNLSDLAVEKLDGIVITSVIDLLVPQMHHLVGDVGSIKFSVSMTDPRDQISLCRCILDIIGNLTCGNSAIKSYLVKLNGIDLIGRILQLASHSFHIHVPSEQQPSRLIGGGGGTDPEGSSLCDSLSNLTLHSTTTLLPAHSSFLAKERTILPQTPFNHPPPDRVPPTLSVPPIPVPSPVSPMTVVATQSPDPFECTYLLSDTRLDGDSLVNRVYSGAPVPTAIPPSSSSSSTSSLNTHLDLLEAGFRCLSHLTAGHKDVPEAVAPFFSHHRLSSRLLGNMANQIIIPLLVHLISTERQTRGRQTQTALSSNCTLVSMAPHTLQFIRAWASLVNNLCSLPTLNDSTSTPPSPSQQHHPRVAVKMGSNRRLPKPLSSQLRRGLRYLLEQLNRLAEVMPTKTKDLTTAHELVHHLLEKFNPVSSQHVAST